MITTIEKIYKLFKKYPEFKNNIKVNTPYGFKNILECDITDNSIPVKILTEKGKSLTGSINHRLMKLNEWIKIKDIKIGDEIVTKDGYEKIKDIITCNEYEDLYDIEVDEVKQYYSNGILSHNSCLIADSISFALYGKPLRGDHVNKEDLINEINKKNCEVTLEFNIGKDNYKVTRMIKPTTFTVFENDVEKKHDSIKHTENWLETKLGISHKCFSNIIVLNMNDTVPFLSMDATDKRTVLEDILNLKIFGKMSDVAKDKHLIAKTESRNYENDLKNATDTLKLAKNRHDNLQKEKEKFELEKSIKINEIQNKLLKYSNEKSVQENTLDGTDYKVLIQDVRDKQSQVNEIQSKFKSRIAVINKEIKDCNEALQTLEHTPHCPVCKTPTDNPLVSNYISETKTKLLEINNENIQISEKIEKASNLYKNFQDKLNEYENKQNKQLKQIDLIKEIDNNIKLLESTLLSEEERTFNVTSVISEEDLSNYKEKYEQSNKLYSGAVKSFNHNSFLRKILGEDGIRKFVMSKVLPFFNVKINQYLKIMGSDLILKFNSNLDTKIFTRGREERSYASFSAGEKKRIDISILMALMDLAKLQNSVDTNILIMDEILDNAMDNEGIENFLTYLKEGFKVLYPDKAVYIITHRNTLNDDFYDRMVILQKKDGFTTIESLVDLKKLSI